MRSFHTCSRFPWPLVLISALLISCGGGGGGGGNNLSTDACGILGLNARIIDGTACQDGSSPVVPVALLNADGTDGLCSGTLITDQDVLTAAHCFIAERVRAAGIVYNGATVEADKVYVHPDARIDQTAVFNDVAVIHLSSRLRGARTLPIIGSRAVATGDIFSIFGYGLDENGNALTLRSGQMRASTVTADHIMASFDGSGSNTCNGDSGGPAIISFTDAAGASVVGVSGIVSSGQRQNCDKGDLALFANVDNPSLLNFIVQAAPSTVVR